MHVTVTVTYDHTASLSAPLHVADCDQSTYYITYVTMKSPTSNRWVLVNNDSVLMKSVLQLLTFFSLALAWFLNEWSIIIHNRSECLIHLNKLYCFGTCLQKSKYNSTNLHKNHMVRSVISILRLSVCMRNGCSVTGHRAPQTSVGATCVLPFLRMGHIGPFNT